MSDQKELVNPRKLHVGYQMEKPSAWARKQYFPVVGDVLREVPYATATAALAEAVRLWKDMCAEYDAKIDAAIAEWYELEKSQEAEMANPSPVTAEEGQSITAEA